MILLLSIVALAALLKVFDNMDQPPDRIRAFLRDTFFVVPCLLLVIGTLFSTAADVIAEAIEELFDDN